MTKQRMLVLAIVNESNDHLTAEEIYAEAKKRIKSIAFATIYNNLNALVRDNYITRIKLPGNPDRFDHLSSPHEHIICDCCGKIKDVHLPNLKDILEDKLNIALTACNLDMHYVCDLCKQQNC